VRGAFEKSRKQLQPGKPDLIDGFSCIKAVPATVDVWESEIGEDKFDEARSALSSDMA